MRLTLFGEPAQDLAQTLLPLTQAARLHTLGPAHVCLYGLSQNLEEAHAACRQAKLDFAFLPETAQLTDYRLFITDMDSTLINIECIDELADLANCKTQVARITEAAMQGKLDFNTALRERVALLAGLPETALETVWQTRLKLNPGAKDWLLHLQTQGFKTILVSGGFTYFTDRFKTELGFDEAYANQLEIKDGHLTGRLLGEVINAQAKKQKLLAACARYNIPPSQTLSAGDGANDLLMAQIAGLAIAYHAKPILQQIAQCNINCAGFEVMPRLFAG